MIDKKLKKIEFEGRTLYYKLRLEDGETMWFSTNFYFTNDESTFRNKWLNLWGPLEEVPANKVIFNLRDNFESPDRLKSENQSYLRYQLALIDRKEEISQGDFV